MHVSNAPVYSSRRPNRLSFVAPLKTLTSRRKDGADIGRRYEQSIAKFVLAVSKTVLGEVYQTFSGDGIPAEVSVVPPSRTDRYSVEINLVAPDGYSIYSLRSVVAAEWGRCSVASGAMFFREKPFMPRQGSTPDYDDRLRRAWWQNTFGVADL